ncbi:MAG: type II toxin-antitoxin system PemK/MazF family toxin [Woeseia sp.]
MKFKPERGRILIVNFEMGGRVPPEITKPGRPCVVLQNNSIRGTGRLLVVPLSTVEPKNVFPYHHKMDHRSFRGSPLEARQPCWALADCVTLVSYDRCKDPHIPEKYTTKRRYQKLMAIKSDIDAIEKCLLWALAIDPAKHSA